MAGVEVEPAGGDGGGELAGHLNQLISEQLWHWRSSKREHGTSSQVLTTEAGSALDRVMNL